MLDSNFIKALKIQFSKVMPLGSLSEIKDEFNVSEHTPSRVLRGVWTDERIVRAALRKVRLHRELLDQFLEQFPED